MVLFVVRHGIAGRDELRMDLEADGGVVELGFRDSILLHLTALYTALSIWQSTHEALTAVLFRKSRNNTSQFYFSKSRCVCILIDPFCLIQACKSPSIKAAAVSPSTTGASLPPTATQRGGLPAVSPPARPLPRDTVPSRGPKSISWVRMGDLHLGVPRFAP